MKEIKVGKNYVQIYTDGACSYNPGIGGWAGIILNDGDIKEVSGGVEDATNNQMELYAVARSLQEISDEMKDQLIAYGDSVIEVFSDSAYVINPLNKGWLNKWVKSKFTAANGRPVKNVKLWKMMLWQIYRLTYAGGITIEFTKVKGHSGNFYNELVDELAKEEVNKIKNKSQE